MCKWENIGHLDESDCDFSVLNRDIGVYRASTDNIIQYIGKATEINNGGFRKRLRDYTRKSDSARKYPSGRLMHKHSSNITIQIHRCARDTTGISDACRIEKEQISKHNPPWNTLDKGERQF